MAFVFAPTPDAKNPRTTRQIHIRRLYDVMQICIQRNDIERANRAWTILAHCKEVDWRTKWSTSVHLLAETLDDPEKTPKKVEFLRLMMLQHFEDREAILKELVLRLILFDQHREALDELELYLPSVPYQDNALLHLYAGLLSMYIAQPTSALSKFNPTLLRSAQSYFERARVLDPNNAAMADAFIRRIQILNGVDTQLREESDEENVEVSSDKPKRKRIRTGDTRK